MPHAVPWLSPPRQQRQVLLSAAVTPLERAPFNKYHPSRLRVVSSDEVTEAEVSPTGLAQSSNGVLSTSLVRFTQCYSRNSSLISKTNSADPTFAPGYSFPAQLDQGATEGLQKETMELQPVESRFFQRGRPTRGQYGRCVPQEICGSRRPRRSGAARCLRSHFVSVPGRFIVVFHQTATADCTPSSPGIRPIAAHARYVHQTAGAHHHPLTIKWKISVLDWTKDRLPITRSKLAHEVAKKLQLYLDNIAVRSYPNGVEFGHSQTT